MITAAFYRSAGGNWMDHAIDRLTGGGGFSHMELIRDGEMFSSSPRDGGVRIKPWDGDPTKWLLLPLSWLTPEQEKRIWDWARERAARIPQIKYDYPGVCHFVLNCIPQNVNEDFCSETCFMGLQAGGEFLDVTPYLTDPNHGMTLVLAKRLEKLDARLQ